MNDDDDTMGEADKEVSQPLSAKQLVELILELAFTITLTIFGKVGIEVSPPLPVKRIVEIVSDAVIRLTPLIFPLAFGIFFLFALIYRSNEVTFILVFFGLWVGTTFVFIIDPYLRRRSGKQKVETKSKAFTVIEALSKRKTFRSTFVGSLCILTGVLMIARNRLPEFSGIFSALMVVGALLILDSLLFTFRVQRGYYGTNDMEAREILKFIMKEASKDDLDGMSGGLRPKVMTDADLDEIKQQVQGPIPQAGS